MKARKSAKPLDLIKIRKRSKLNQSKFWGPIGVTQSGGSRYESGRTPPLPVQLLIRLIYNKDEAAAIEELKDIRAKTTAG